MELGIIAAALLILFIGFLMGCAVGSSCDHSDDSYTYTRKSLADELWSLQQRRADNFYYPPIATWEVEKQREYGRGYRDGYVDSIERGEKLKNN